MLHKFKYVKIERIFWFSADEQRQSRRQAGGSASAELLQLVSRLVLWFKPIV